MSLRFVDSYAHMGTLTGLLARKWTATAGAVNFTTSLTETSSGFGLQLIAGFLTPGSVRRTLTHKAEWYVGTRVYVGDFGGGYHGMHNNTVIVAWNINVDGTITIRAGSTAIATSLNSIHFGGKYYIEIGYTLSGTTNISVTATLTVNGVAWASGTANSGINNNTLLIGTTTINNHQLFGPGNVSNITVSDTYICDGDGTANKTFLGDVSVIAIYPNGDVVSQWTTSTGTTHNTLVNEHIPDDDTTYVKDGTATHQDIYDWDDIPAFTGTICGVQMSVYARKDAEGTKTFKQVVGDTGTEASSDTYSPSDDYLYYSFCYDLDPGTGIAWTRAGFNAKRFGVNLVS